MSVRNPITTAQAAQQLGVSGQTVRNWIHEGILRGYIITRDGKRACVRTDQQAVDEFWERYSNQTSKRDK